MTPPRHRLDADARLIRRTSWTVGLWITIAASVLVIVVVVITFAIVLREIPLRDLFDQRRHEEKVDVGGLDILVSAIVIGFLAIVLAATLSLIVTRRAVAPLVDALARQRRFVADASHELRTPLAVLDARLQVLQRSLPPGDPHGAVVAELRADTRAVIAVVADLLDSVDVTSTGRQPPVALAPIVQTAVSSMRMLAEDQGIRVDAAPVGEDVLVAIPETSLHRALTALIDNALKHSAPGQSVTVTTAVERGQVRIAVTDQGAGIQGIAPERIFDRFARSSEAVDGGGTTRSGFGIGLSLVQDTAGRFGGSVEVTDTSESGTTITLTLPKPKAR